MLDQVLSPIATQHPVSKLRFQRSTIEAFAIALILTGVSYLAGSLAGWVESLSLLEMFAVFTSYACTYLCVKERRINYPIGALSTLAYAILFYQQGLMASMLLNLYLTPSLIYGWFRWGRDSTTRPVGTVGIKWWPVYVLVTATAYLGATLLNNALGGTMAWGDGVILVGSILAQFLLDNKKIETWAVWLVVNGFAIYVYASSGLTLVAFQYVFFLLNAFYGFSVWQRSRKQGVSL